jgi:hypothetical protein
VPRPADLDLSDDAGFTAGLEALDEEARRMGRRLLSGASSVPGISSAVAAELCRGFDEILLIDTAILPGNRAPRGISVIASIVGQLGAVSSVWRGGVWRDQPCWSDPQCVRLAPDLIRIGRFIEVPDIRLFPRFFGARSVMFRAGMELGLLNTALRGLGVLRRCWPFKVTVRRARLLQRLANLLLPFGTDRGGMRVAVVGRRGGTVNRREWRPRSPRPATVLHPSGGRAGSDPPHGSGPAGSAPLSCGSHAGGNRGGHVGPFRHHRPRR